MSWSQPFYFKLETGCTLILLCSWFIHGKITSPHFSNLDSVMTEGEQHNSNSIQINKSLWRWWESSMFSNIILFYFKHGCIIAIMCYAYTSVICIHFQTLIYIVKLAWQQKCTLVSIFSFTFSKTCTSSFGNHSVIPQLLLKLFETLLLIFVKGTCWGMVSSNQQPHQ